MNPEKFTHKTNEALAAGQELATEAGHAQYTPVHLVLALLDDSDGLLRQAVQSASGSEGTIASVERVLKNTLKKIPSQSPAPDASPANNALIKCIRKAQSLQKSRGDSHLAVDQLILALLDDAQIADCFKEAGISAAR
jgi:ATP-dependent Clp protease ATP-binding subunit ClpB